MKTRTPDSSRLSGVFGSLSTVEGEIELSMRENQIGSLFSNIQSDENYHSKCSKEPNDVLLVINHRQREYPNYKIAFKVLRNKR
mgnify:FL=1